MARQNIDTGSIPNNRKGDPLRNAFIKINSNFTEIYPNPLPPTFQQSLFSYMFFNFTPSTSYGYQPYRLYDDDDGSPGSETWDVEVRRNLFYVEKTGILKKIIVSYSGNVNANFAIVTNPTIGSLVANTTWDFETVITTNGGSSSYLVEPNLSISEDSLIGIAIKTTTLTTTRIGLSTIWGSVEFT